MGGDPEHPKRKSTVAGNWRHCDVKGKCYFPEIKAESGNTIITWTQIYSKLQAHGTGRSLWHTLIHHCCVERRNRCGIWALVCKSTIWYKRNCGPSLAKTVTDRMFRVGGFLPSCFGDIQLIHLAIHFLWKTENTFLQTVCGNVLNVYFSLNSICTDLDLTGSYAHNTVTVLGSFRAGHEENNDLNEWVRTASTDSFSEWVIRLIQTVSLWVQDCFDRFISF